MTKTPTFKAVKHCKRTNNKGYIKIPNDFIGLIQIASIHKNTITRLNISLFFVDTLRGLIFLRIPLNTKLILEYYADILTTKELFENP